MAALNNHSLFFCSWCPAFSVCWLFPIHYSHPHVQVSKRLSSLKKSYEKNAGESGVPTNQKDVPGAKHKEVLGKSKIRRETFWPYNRLLIVRTDIRTDMAHLPATCILGRCKSTCHFLGQYFPCKTGNLFSVSIWACSTNWILRYSQFCGGPGKMSFKYSSYQMDAKRHLKTPPNTQHLSVLHNLPSVIALVALLPVVRITTFLLYVWVLSWYLSSKFPEQVDFYGIHSISICRDTSRYSIISHNTHILHFFPKEFADVSFTTPSPVLS